MLPSGTHERAVIALPDFLRTLPLSSPPSWPPNLPPSPSASTASFIIATQYLTCLLPVRPGGGKEEGEGRKERRRATGDVWGRKGCQGGVLKRCAGVTEAMTACFLTYSSSAYGSLCPVPFFPLFFASSDILPSDPHPSLALPPSFRLPPFPLRSLLYEE